MKPQLSFRVKIVLILAAVLSLLAISSVYTVYRNESASVMSSNVVKEIIIDAGHGAPDGGSIGTDGTPEKDINLQIAQKLRAILTLYGYETVMVRDGDDGIFGDEAKTIRQKKVSDIHRREALMRSHPDAIFVSIHQNHFGDAAVHGTQVFYSGNRTESKSLAQSVQDAVAAILQPENHKQVKRSGTEIYLLYHAAIPAIMVECGFISNPQELQLLKNETYQKKLAIAIADGIIKYMNESDETYGKG